jgi:paraquat-inducible protein A
MLYDSGLSSVGLVVFASTVAIPAAFLLSCAYVSFSLILGRRLPFTRVALKSALKLKRWCMTDVFIIGILVSVVKMVDLADVKFDTGIYLLMISALFTVLTEQHFNVSLFWHRLASHE